MVRTTHGTLHPRVFWQAFGGLFILTATMGMGDCGNNNPAVSIAQSGWAPGGGSSSGALSASLVQQAYVKASNAEAFDNFGNNVAIS